jgi:hypothetical protein
LRHHQDRGRDAFGERGAPYLSLEGDARLVFSPSPDPAYVHGAYYMDGG